MKISDFKVGKYLKKNRCCVEKKIGLYCLYRMCIQGLHSRKLAWCATDVDNSRGRRDVTALATQVNKYTAVNWPVNFYITGEGKMMKNGPYLFVFSNFSISLRLFRRKIIVICPSMMNLVIIAAIFHKLLKKNPPVWVG